MSENESNHPNTIDSNLRVAKNTDVNDELFVESICEPLQRLEVDSENNRQVDPPTNKFSTNEVALLLPKNNSPKEKSSNCEQPHLNELQTSIYKVHKKRSKPNRFKSGNSCRMCTCL